MESNYFLFLLEGAKMVAHAGPRVASPSDRLSKPAQMRLEARGGWVRGGEIAWQMRGRGG